MATQPTVSKIATSFANIVQQEKTLSRDQAIVIDAVEGHLVEEYADSLAITINPKDMLYVSRISGSRICFYLSSVQLANKLIDDNIKIKIGGEDLRIKPLVSKSIRIIISNIQPCVPISLIEEELNKLNIFPTSRITTMKAGIHSSIVGHLLSFRKQMYVHPEDLSKIPPSIRITHEKQNYWIYFSSEKLTCFQCQEEGHLARFCKNTDSISSENIASTQPVKNIADDIPASTSIANSCSIDSSMEEEVHLPSSSNAGFKRPHSSSTSSISNKEIEKNVAAFRGNNYKIKQVKKRQKTRTSLQSTMLLN